jgi:hypothetical protein
MSLIQLYRDLTIVGVGDGKTTYFWLDSWLGNKPLSIQFPTLFSHVQSPIATIADCFFQNGWALRFRHITSRSRANQELGLLLDRLIKCLVATTRMIGSCVSTLIRTFRLKVAIMIWTLVVFLLQATRKFGALWPRTNARFLHGWLSIIALPQKKDLPGGGSWRRQDAHLGAKQKKA